MLLLIRAQRMFQVIEYVQSGHVVVVPLEGEEQPREERSVELHAARFTKVPQLDALGRDEKKKKYRNNVR